MDQIKSNSGILQIADQDQRRENLAGLRVLITGVNGFLGSHAAVHAQCMGATVSGIDLEGTSGRGESLRGSLGGLPFTMEEIPSFEPVLLKELIHAFKPDLLLHIAGATRRDAAPEAWSTCARGNILTTVNLIEALLQFPQETRPVLVVPGSQMEYGNALAPWNEDTVCQPTNAYGASKLAVTECIATACKSYGLKAVVMRLALVFGPGQPPVMFAPELIIKALAGQDFPMTEGIQTRRFVYVADAVRSMLIAGLRILQGEELPIILNAPAQRPVTILEMAQRILNTTKSTSRLLPGAIPQRPGEPLIAWPDTTQADALMLLHSSSELERAISETVAWYREN